MSDIAREILVSPEFKRIRELCRELSYEARKLNIGKDVIIHGVSWDFLGALRVWGLPGKDDAAVESYKYADALRIIKILLDDSECYCPNPEESFGRGPCAFCKAQEFLSMIRAGKGEK